MANPTLPPQAADDPPVRPSYREVEKAFKRILECTPGSPELGFDSLVVWAALEALKPSFPRGQLNPSDEGALQVAIGVERNAVVVRFPKPVAWIGLGRDEARALALLLTKRAAELP